MTRDAEHTPSPQSVVVPLEDWRHVIGALKNAKARLPLGAAIGNVSDALSKVQHLQPAPAPSSLAGGEWRDPSEVPEAKKGEYAYRIVAVKRADGEKVVSFSAFYMNAVPLWFEDDNESRNVTGWHSDSEGDDGPTYSPLLTEGDALMGWREFPRWEAALSPEAPAREGVASDLLNLKEQFERIAAKPAEEQPCYASGVRPFGTGDLRHFIETLTVAAAALTPRHEAPARNLLDPDAPSEAMIDAGLKVDWSNEDERGTVINVWYAMNAARRHEAPAEGAGSRPCSRTSARSTSTHR